MDILKKLGEKSKVLDIPSLIDPEQPKTVKEVPRNRTNEFFDKRRQNYLYHLWYKGKQLVVEFVREYDVKTKFKVVTFLVLDVSFTGLLIAVVLTQRNWIGYGIAAGLIYYYLEWFVRLCKEK